MKRMVKWLGAGTPLLALVVAGCDTGERLETDTAPAAEQLGLTGVRLETEEVVQAGPDMAYESGTGVLETEQGSSEAKYVVIWRRGDDGQWRWHVDIWNEKPSSRWRSAPLATES